MHFAYLDEFGHIGPYRKGDPRYSDSPVFGLGGIILPAHEVRAFSTWFYQRKCELLNFEITRSGKHAAEWEKKGAALYTSRNVERYPELRRYTNRLLNRLDRSGGKIIYVGIRKTVSITEHKPLGLYKAVLRETLKRLDQFCDIDCAETSRMLVFMDEHQERNAIVRAASRSMFHPEHPQMHMVEPPVQVESHRYQTLQAADWVCGLVGRLASYQADSQTFSEFAWAQELFGSRIARLTIRSGIRQEKASRGETD